MRFEFYVCETSGDAIEAVRGLERGARVLYNTLIDTEQSDPEEPVPAEDGVLLEIPFNEVPGEALPRVNFADKFIVLAVMP